jgi:hypothetical protein
LLTIITLPPRPPTVAAPKPSADGKALRPVVPGTGTGVVGTVGIVGGVGVVGTVGGVGVVGLVGGVGVVGFGGGVVDPPVALPLSADALGGVTSAHAASPNRGRTATANSKP